MMARDNCPLGYRYGPEVFDRAPTFTAHTLYVAGGLYGNVLALRALLDLRRREEKERHTPIDLCINGDFNWLNIDRADFAEINESVLNEHAIRGNVETELVNSPSVGCGCNYPAYVGDDAVALSNAVFNRLHLVGADHPVLLSRLEALPMSMTVAMADQRIGILHGDPTSLAGWGFAVESMPPPDEALRHRLGCTPGGGTSMGQIEEYFRAAQVQVFAATHTGLPFMQDFRVADSQRLVANNGAAGLPNFHNTQYGIITRISLDPAPPINSLYGTSMGKLRCDAIPLEYDCAAFQRRFLATWPAGTPGHSLYWDRIRFGPDFARDEAVRLHR